MMPEQEFVKQQFITLRSEILASKVRSFWILIVGVILVVLAAYLSAGEPQIFANAAIPLVLLVLILAFAVEQSSIIRAGRYIRERIEPGTENGMGWEKWLESNPVYREVDRFFFGGFIVVFLAFYAISCSLSLYQLDKLQTGVFTICAAVIYGLGLLCMIIVLIRHWHSCTSTTDDEPSELEATE